MAKVAAHSELGASSYSRWKACPGSVNSSRGIPKTESEYAKQGTRAHGVAAAILLGDDALPSMDVEDEEAVEVYVKYIQSHRQMRPTFEAIEQKFDLSKYHPKLFGTADYVAYFKDFKHLVVVDYKHGAGVPVEVVGNRQLMYYGLGALHNNSFPVDRVTLVIVQPRCFHSDGPIRSWIVTPLELLDFAADLIEDAKKTEDPNAPLVSGDHCRWCPAQGICPEVHKNSLEAARNVFSSEISYDADKLSKTLILLPQVEAWAKAVREFAYREAVSGRVPKGFKLVEKRAVRKWRDDFEPNEDFCYEDKLLSPAQLEKKMGKEVFEDVWAKHTIKESSGFSLVPDSDAREPKNLIEDAFGGEK